MGLNFGVVKSYLFMSCKAFSKHQKDSIILTGTLSSRGKGTEAKVLADGASGLVGLSLGARRRDHS